MKHISLNDYKSRTHYMLIEFTVETKCGKIFRILKTTKGFSDKRNGGYYVSPLIMAGNGDDEVAVMDSQESVILYLENKGWLSYKKMKIRKIINSLITNAK